MPELVCFGNPAVDFIHSNKGTFMYAGGPEMNTAVIFTQLGGTSGIIGRIGKDKYGKFLLSKFRKFKIDYSHIRIDKRPTHLVDVTITPKDRILKLLNPHYDVKLSPADEKYLKTSRAAYVRLSVKRFPEYAKLATKLKKSLYVSAHFYKGKQKYDLRKYGIKAIIGNSNEINLVKRFCKISASADLIITKGSNGSSAVIDDNEIKVPAFKVKSVDTTGAGDAFAAGYIFADLNGKEIKERLRFANACGAITTQRLGAQQKITLHEIKKLFAGQVF